MISTRQLAYKYLGGAEIRFEDMAVPQGGVVLLRGASGSGKSSWLALAAGFWRRRQATSPLPASPWPRWARWRVTPGAPERLVFCRRDCI